MTPAPNPPPVAESVEVTQADLDAAATLFTIRGHDGDRVREAVSLLLARHRAASHEAGRIAGVREAAEVCERKSKALMAKANGPSFLTEITRGMAGVAKDNANAIRALSKGEIDGE